jgi:hypothetical protein
MFSDSTKLLGVAVYVGGNFIIIITLVFVKDFNVVIDYTKFCVFDL